MSEKKGKEFRVKLPFVEYHWFKEINQDKPNIDFINNQINSFMFLIENKDKVDIENFIEELREFTKLIVAEGHLMMLGDSYKEMFLKITEFSKLKSKEKSLLPLKSIQNKIDSIDSILNKNEKALNYFGSELKNFINEILDKGYFIDLNEEYQKKYKRITDYYVTNWSGVGIDF